ncbi:uncharacterized protein FFUJ_04825 [Fusarium fujikuroi IMI 58289]|uniref:Uncharacterized protein n=1 Tax=Gibberella fujikuroi (strain CBS 195.34 / IMI 58289 / NRRL A-6831) TaxID=1279085 RepID=S0DN37_GIBF5|nr:uncharacterized protein FFUJ_04825 [Fusarium fujikuroi IMI 58289]CCT63999.1 uncharacterized protein FFUJ_04825 [Fusarium fujikuroi IMI 58289]SCN99402.1 uncharacterized protein FFM5_07184 [Fusarium fujikuroi]
MVINVKDIGWLTLFGDPGHGAHASGIRGLLRGFSKRRPESRQDTTAGEKRARRWTLPKEGECKSWSLEELQVEYEILRRKYKEADQLYLDKAKITERKVTVHSENVANQCREWVHDCKKTLQSLEGDLKLVINKKGVKAVITHACKHPTQDNVNLATKEIHDADKRIRARCRNIGTSVKKMTEDLGKLRIIL